MISISGFCQGRWTGSTSTATPDSAPNAAFINDPSVVSDKRLDTPNIAITSATAQVTFRNNYALEPIGGGVNFFDGAVLEVSSPNIAGGAFTDITNAAVGGSFVTGGYNGTISTSFSSPLGGRMAWSQSSGGYINTVANLGPNVNGQTIKLRFRMGSDSSVTGTGWRIDNVVVTGGACGTPTPTPTPGGTATPTPTPGGTPTPTPTCAPTVQLSQTFDDITTLVPGGWFMQNNSQPGPGTTGWFQGNSTVFPSQSGAGHLLYWRELQQRHWHIDSEQLVADAADDVAGRRRVHLLDPDGKHTGIPRPVAGAHEHERGKYRMWAQRDERGRLHDAAARH